MAVKGADITGFIARDQWGAKPTKSSCQMKTPVKLVFIHHTAGKHSQSVEEGKDIIKSIQRFHQVDRSWDDIGYNFLVDEEGYVYEGRGWHRVGAHTKGWNDVSVAFTVMGNFCDREPNNKAIKAVLNMIQLGIEQNKISKDYKLHGHRDVGATECPGDKLYKIISKLDRFSREKPAK